jgi:transposase
LLQAIGSTPGHAGAPAIDPRILFTLWLPATSDGIGSARRLAKLTQEHLVYQWITGEQAINAHTLSDFRVAHPNLLDQLLTDSVATLLHAQIIDLNRVAQDGMKVRASAGGSSFRRPATLQECLHQAKEQVDALRNQIDEDSGAASRRQQAAKERALQDRIERLHQAQEELKQRQKHNEQQRKDRQVDPEQLRVSTTDPQARKRKMADGGFRPAYNVQLSTLTNGGIIVGVAVSNHGTDSEEMEPMIEQLESRYGQKPQQVLVDGGFVSLEAIHRVEEKPIEVYAPIRDEAKKLASGIDPYQPQPKDQEGTAKWRKRMGSEEAKAIYRERASTAEWVNAQCRNRGLYQFRIRGLEKVRSVVLWYALSQNLVQSGYLKRTRSEGIAP